jgi:hypothetical protein
MVHRVREYSENIMGEFRTKSYIRFRSTSTNGTTERGIIQKILRENLGKSEAGKVSGKE